jgi:hypothetical protein
MVRKFAARDAALIACFSALYAVLSFLPISPIIGLPGKAITAAAIVAPIIGMILGPLAGTLSTILGGIIGFSAGSLSPPSLLAGAFTALCAGMLCAGKRIQCIPIYLSLLISFGLYPSIGPIWLYPQVMWFQTIGLLILASPIQSIALKNLNSNNNSKLLFALFTTFLTSTLMGQIAGSLTFEIILWLTTIPDVNVWRANWQALTFLYPLERTIIALSAALLGIAIRKTIGQYLAIFGKSRLTQPQTSC